MGQEDPGGFQQRALAWYARLGVRVEQVTTDNGLAYRSMRFDAVLREASVRHVSA